MTRFSVDPPDDDGPDPRRCACGDELVTYDSEPLCPTCDLAGAEEPDSEATRRADYLLDQDDDEVSF